MCKVAGVSKSTFYYNRNNDRQAQKDAQIITLLKKLPKEIILRRGNKAKAIILRQNVFADFLSKLHDNKIKVKFDDDKTFTFFIEDPFVRMTLEGLLKKNQGITIDYSFNRELIKIKREDFITLLIEESAKGNKDEKNNKDEFVKSLQKQLTAEQIKKFGLTTLAIIEKSLNLTALFMPIIKTALSFM